ncbi:glycoside hydrolase family 3 C-terminal domain-containing protein [Streptomyces sp. SPB162]|uniref:glycoside hydrolase family 3 C-terminal domain-containing protein n=1 Tax=Streptomyces sp. SPB162 TaxID=2940560 RepID=UPI002406BF3F|nr:glycoside hydrolase family 3 C-terminal domain-containing protein [Streptomyces sp. SPB162]MDF9811009.1 beta-glucosidase [Streptomyces sp. SPB162]
MTVTAEDPTEPAVPGAPVPPGAVPPATAALPSAEELDRLIAKLDLTAKVRLLSGSAVFRTPAEPAVGLRAMTFSDGPVGVRGERWDERDAALTLPSPTALAACWDEQLVEELGGLLASEARRKRIDVLLAPTLNLHRSPVGGRHFECFSEDPLLTGRTGAAYVRGVQGGGVAATAKHYVANDSETERLTLDAHIDERTLREVYLAPFEAAVQAGAWVVMSAYNAVNGTAMSESPLLDEPLKGEWGFDGLVVSDWGAVRSTAASARAAQDLSMPGPNALWGAALVRAVEDGTVPEAAIDAKLRRILRLAARVGALAGPPPRPVPPPAPSPEAARALLRRAVAAGAVLLRNEDALLPLNRARLRSVAVIGPNAAAARIQGGGSAGVFPAAALSPLEGIRGALEGGTEVRHCAGVFLTARPTPLSARNAYDPRTGEPGVLVRYLDDQDAEVHVEHRLSGRILEPTDAGADISAATTVEVSAVLRPDRSGVWRFAVVGLGQVSLRVDGRTLIDEYVAPESRDPTYLHVAPSFRQVPWQVEAGQDVRLVARRRMEADSGYPVALAADPPRRDEDAELAAAVECARSADLAIVVVGTTDEFESEGFDRPGLALPGRQDELVAAVAAANQRTVVIVNSGGPVEMPWRSSVPAVLLGWFPGQEAGDGLADVLFGAAEPGGRLPTTWAARTEDVPVLDTVPVDGVLRYAEGPRIGYQAWLHATNEPAFWFGHGLGYTRWSYEGLSAPKALAAGAALTVHVRLRNTGARAGREVVQVYLSRPPDASARGPERRLAGYAAVRAEPGETVTAAVRVEPRAFQYWSPEHAGWRTEPGDVVLFAGSSSAELPLRARLTVTAEPEPSP